MIRERADELHGVRPAHRPRRRPGRRAVGRDEAPAHHRPRTGQPARARAARRADDRARPAGPPPRVGAALPAEAPGRDARAHDALHGRGRAALRPARDHGRRPHRRRGLAAPAHRPALRPERSSSCGSTRTTTEQGAGADRRPSDDRRSRRSPTGSSLYTDDGEAEVEQPRGRRRAPRVRARATRIARGRVPHA